MPKLIPTLGGMWADFPDLVAKTLEGFITCFCYKEMDPSEMYHAYFSGGFDGAGSFSIYRKLGWVQFYRFLVAEVSLLASFASFLSDF